MVPVEAHAACRPADRVRTRLNVLPAEPVVPQWNGWNGRRGSPAGLASVPNLRYSAPMNEAIQRQLQARIEAFASDVTEILTRAVADSVAAALGGSPRSGAKRVPATSARSRRPKSGRGSSLDTETVLTEVRRKGDRRVEELAKSLRTSTRSLRLPLKKLIAAKKVKTTGQRRGMRYTARR